MSLSWFLECIAVLMLQIATVFGRAPTRLRYSRSPGKGVPNRSSTGWRPACSSSRPSHRDLIPLSTAWWWHDAEILVDAHRAKKHCTSPSEIIDAFFKNCCRNGIETAWLWRRTHYDCPSLIFRTRPKIRKWRDGGEQYLRRPMTTRGAANRLDLLAEELEKSISC